MRRLGKKEIVFPPEDKPREKGCMNTRNGIARTRPDILYQTNHIGRRGDELPWEYQQGCPFLSALLCLKDPALETAGYMYQVSELKCSMDADLM